MRYKNLVLEKIKESGSITDISLTKGIAKDGYILHEGIISRSSNDLLIMPSCKI
jgi:hypothetical protein